MTSFARSTHHAVAISASGIPLFLVLLVGLRLAHSGKLPERRFDVYDRAADLLIAEHPARRRVAAAVTAHRKRLVDRQIRAVLAEVAFVGLERGDIGAIPMRDLRRDLLSAWEALTTLASIRNRLQRQSMSYWMLLKVNSASSYVEDQANWAFFIECSKTSSPPSTCPIDSPPMCSRNFSTNVSATGDRAKYSSQCFGDFGARPRCGHSWMWFAGGSTRRQLA